MELKNWMVRLNLLKNKKIKDISPLLILQSADRISYDIIAGPFPWDSIPFWNRSDYLLG